MTYRDRFLGCLNAEIGEPILPISPHRDLVCRYQNFVLILLGYRHTYHRICLMQRG